MTSAARSGQRAVIDARARLRLRPSDRSTPVRWPAATAIGDGCQLRPATPRTPSCFLRSRAISLRASCGERARGPARRVGARAVDWRAAGDRAAAGARARRAAIDGERRGRADADDRRGCWRGIGPDVPATSALATTADPAAALHLPVDAAAGARDAAAGDEPSRSRAAVRDASQRWGITTLGDLAALPAATVVAARAARRGAAAARARARSAAVRARRETPRYIERLELEWPIDALEPLSFVFARLLEPLSVALERADRGAAAVRLESAADRSRRRIARVLQLPAPMRDPAVLRTLLLLDLESHSARPRRSTSSTIELDPAPARITQFSLLERALPSPETLSTLTARLSALVGESRSDRRCWSTRHRPGAFAMARYAPEIRC